MSSLGLSGHDWLSELISYSKSGGRSLSEGVRLGSCRPLDAESCGPLVEPSDELAPTRRDAIALPQRILIPDSTTANAPTTIQSHPTAPAAKNLFSKNRNRAGIAIHVYAKSRIVGLLLIRHVYRIHTLGDGTAPDETRGMLTSFSDAIETRLRRRRLRHVENDLARTHRLNPVSIRPATCRPILPTRHSAPDTYDSAAFPAMQSAHRCMTGRRFSSRSSRA